MNRFPFVYSSFVVCSAFLSLVQFFYAIYLWPIAVGVCHNVGDLATNGYAKYQKHQISKHRMDRMQVKTVGCVISKITIANALKPAVEVIGFMRKPFVPHIQQKEENKKDNSHDVVCKCNSRCT